MSEPKTVYAGVRKIQNQQGTIVISAPKRELREALGVDAEDLEGQHAQVQLTDDGEMTVDIPSNAD